MSNVFSLSYWSCFLHKIWAYSKTSLILVENKTLVLFKNNSVYQELKVNVACTGETISTRLALLRGVVVVTTHNFIQDCLNSGSAQVQILLAVCRRFSMVRIYGNGLRLSTFRRSTIPKKQFITIVIKTPASILSNMHGLKLVRDANFGMGVSKEYLVNFT